MKNLGKYSRVLILQNIIIAFSGYLILAVTRQSSFFAELLILLVAFSGISLLTVFLFMKGQSKDARTQTFYSLVTISLKFLLDLFLALIWFAIAKKNSLTSVLIFFVLYLSLTLGSVFFILNKLKKKLL